MDYIEYKFEVDNPDPVNQILIAELGDVGFESFVESDNGISAYIQKKDWYDCILSDIQILNSDEFQISFEKKEIETVNWNAEWEKDFQPIIVDSQCTVRAPFHNVPDTMYDLVIEPKMSFGTGHHETTYMMIQHILKNDFNGKTVLDMGCGTGVLAILSEKVGAHKIDAIDIDNWCFLNSIENVQRNECDCISVYEGDASLLKGRHYDVIIANINRNALLNDIGYYSDCLNNEGMLFLSGFYKDDIPLIEEECQKHMLKLAEIKERGQWVALKFIN